MLSIWLYLFTEKQKTALFFLTIGAFTLRLAMISLDPYLNEWDERFHTLVAKNMVQQPFIPMLRVQPILNYNYTAWCCNHIWVHKQPLFLWQIATSLKLFGLNEIALRLPSAILGTLCIPLVYGIANFWTNQHKLAYLSTLLFAIGYYILELTTGRYGTDYNDICFLIL